MKITKIMLSISLILLILSCHLVSSHIKIKEGIWRDIKIEYVAGEVLFKPNNGILTPQTITELNKLGATDISKLDKFGIARALYNEELDIPGLCSSLMKTDLFEFAEPNGLYYYSADWPNDPLIDIQWYLITAGATSAWMYSIGSRDVIIAILDSGISMSSGGTSLNHEDLDNSNKIIIGEDFWGDGESVRDLNGHGTMCAGIASAETNNNKGIAGFCPNASLLIVQVGDEFGGASFASVSNGINYVADYDATAKIINLSLGGYNYSSIVENAIDYAHQKGVFIAAASGNDGAGQIHYPARHSADYDNVIAVGATDITDEKASYSNYGAELNVIAPGGTDVPINDGNDIYSTTPVYSYYMQQGYPNMGLNYSWNLGTSFSTPQVAALAALILSRTPDLTPAIVRNIIEQTADDKETPGWDILTGWGRINAYKAMRVSAPMLDGLLLQNGVPYPRCSWSWYPSPVYTKDRYELYTTEVYYGAPPGYQTDPCYVGTAGYRDFPEFPVPSGYRIDFLLYGYTQELPTYPFISNEVRLFNGYGGDPKVAPTADTYCTAYNNARKITVDSNDRIHITYTSNDTVYYVYSDDCSTFSETQKLGEGKFPSIALDSKESPNICWIYVQQDGTTPYSFADVYFSKLKDAGWMKPVSIYKVKIEQGGFTPISFDISNDDRGHIIWGDILEGVKYWEIKKGDFNTLDLVPQVTYTQVDTAQQMVPESPMYICDREKVNGYLIYEKSGEVYSAIDQNGNIVEKQNVSGSMNPSIHPSLSAWGDSIYAVWQEEFPFTSKIMQSTRRAEAYGTWSEPKEITGFSDIVEFPVCIGPLVVAASKTKEKEFEVVGIMSEEFDDVKNNFMLTSTQTSSRFPSICYTQRFPMQKLYYVWTEDTTKIHGRGVPHQIGYAKVTSIVPPPIPISAVDLGKMKDSPYTVQRSEIKSWGWATHAYETSDCDPKSLIYHFQNLAPNKRYKVKLVFYYETDTEEKAQVNKVWKMKVKADKKNLGTIEIPPSEVTRMEVFLPPEIHQDGSFTLEIKRKKGDFSICSEIFIYEFEDQNKHSILSADTQEDYNKIKDILLFSCKPNPFGSSIQISLQLQQDLNTSVKIFDLSGRLITKLIDRKMLKGNYTLNWNAKDNNGKSISQGIYFIVVNAGGTKKVTKVSLMY